MELSVSGVTGFSVKMFSLISYSPSAFMSSVDVHHIVIFPNLNVLPIGLLQPHIVAHILLQCIITMPRKMSFYYNFNDNII